MKFFGKRIRVRLAIKIEQRGKQILDQTVTSQLLRWLRICACMGSVEIVLTSPPPLFYCVVSDVEICFLG